MGIAAVIGSVTLVPGFIAFSRGDSTKNHMGLTSWENAPDGKIVKTDDVRQIS